MIIKGKLILLVRFRFSFRYKFYQENFYAGSPGSTPYNNMYLTKDQSSGSDPSSASPTYSEVSTEYCLENGSIIQQNITMMYTFFFF